MKYFYTSLFFFLFFFSGIHSQNYRMVNANSEFFFTANSFTLQDEVFGFKCDSVRGTISDSTFFPYRTVKAVLPADSACNVDPSYPIWAGSKIVISNNGIHKWLTFSGDSLIINTQTNPGDTQQIYLYGNGNRIIAIHSSNTQLTFAAIIDSVKNYTLQILDPANTIVPGYWNNKTIIVSKNNGVVQMPAVINFPNDTSMFSRVNARRLKYDDLYHWQAGDELHEYRYNLSQLPPFYNTSWTYNKYILSRTMINPDSVVFTIRRVTHMVSNGPPVNTITTDTITLRVGSLSSYIETEMPQQTIDSVRTYDLFLLPSDCGKLRMIDHTMTAFSTNGPGCVQENNFEPHNYDVISIEGVAGYYFYDFPWAGNSGTSDDFHPVYYSIGSSTCGTPLYIGIQESAETDFNVWPNPTSDFLNFNFSGNYSGYTFEIFDVTGKQIQSVRLEQNIPVDVRNLANGFYLGKIISPDGNQQSNIRFVKN